MKRILIGLTSLSITFILLAGCAGGGAGGGATIVTGEYAIMSSGDHIGMISIWSSAFMPVGSATVTISNEPLIFNGLWYQDSDFITPAPIEGQQISFKVVNEGSTLLDDSLALPGDTPNITGPSGDQDVSGSIEITWDALTGAADMIRLSISPIDTVSDDGYEVELSPGATSHSIPANTIDPSWGSATITVSAMNSKIIGSTVAIFTETQDTIDITTVP